MLRPVRSPPVSSDPAGYARTEERERDRERGWETERDRSQGDVYVGMKAEGARVKACVSH